MSKVCERSKIALSSKAFNLLWLSGINSVSANVEMLISLGCLGHVQGLRSRGCQDWSCQSGLPGTGYPSLLMNLLVCQAQTHSGTALHPLSDVLKNGGSSDTWRWPLKSLLFCPEQTNWDPHSSSTLQLWKLPGMWLGLTLLQSDAFPNWQQQTRFFTQDLKVSGKKSGFIHIRYEYYVLGLFSQ